MFTVILALFKFFRQIYLKIKFPSGKNKNKSDPEKPNSTNTNCENRNTYILDNENSLYVKSHSLLFSLCNFTSNPMGVRFKSKCIGFKLNARIVRY